MPSPSPNPDCPLQSPLCGGPIRDSHIVPEFLCTRVKGELGVFVSKRQPYPGHARRGLTELLLCDGCETFLNKEYETPASAFWRQFIPDVVDVPELLFAVDYPTMKLLHLSIFW